MLYYHVTKSKYLDSIRKDGLIAKRGDNAILCTERKPAIFLSDERSIPHWLILTESDTVLSVDLSEPPEESFEYECYKEFITYKDIPKNTMKEHPLPKEPEMNKAMAELAENYFYTINNICYTMLRCEKLHDINPDDIQEMCQCVNGTIEIAKRINFKTVPQKEYVRMIKDYSNEECGISFADYYYVGADRNQIPDAGKRCFEHLPNMAEPFRETALKLHAFITKTFSKQVLHVQDIGGFWM